MRGWWLLSAWSGAAAQESAPAALSWGMNYQGQLGDGTNDDRALPGDVALPEDVTLTSIAAGHAHGLAVASDGRLFAWGSNWAGQLGVGDTDNRMTPVEVTLPGNVTDIAAGSGHSLAVASDGRLFAWGSNWAGQLGVGDTNDRLTPVELTLPGDVTVTTIAAGAEHSLAVASDGRLFAWGSNWTGQLGVGDETSRDTPVEVPLPGDVTVAGIAAGDRHSLAVASDGRLFAWGSNAFGQLGVGDRDYRITPVEVTLPGNVTVTDIAAGLGHSLAIASDGRLFAWGLNIAGQLGVGDADYRITPVEVALPGNVTVTDIAAGAEQSLAVVRRATSATALIADPAQAQTGEPVALTVNVTCTTGAPTGEVTFTDGERDLGTVNLTAAGTATLTVSDLPEGEHTITARYAGDGTCPASESDPVTVTIRAANGSITVKKTDTETGEAITGAVFQLWLESNGTPGLQRTDTKIDPGCATDDLGRCTFTDLPDGTYYLRETAVPDSYAKPERPVTTVELTDGATLTEQIGNTPSTCRKGDKNCA
ncbi:hypothetical protein SRB5_03150 [Streptomyces sp. RB5]|uniref:Uncharacterized protein n=1 Tax=Streptomyces smaragdinus TaxID=2585196 RepID=A0A7K0C9V8_9ACTN|nr:Ig-like domain repeat protein [Streptomyces smaragdinus]MQY10208.1 hypothetical protein [Streptomyces smaragdinus]